ncbi:MAG: AprI/Inh family metalloprotease inhibitor [Alphaproteobacteria bacterium]|nr:AprI/Inh family metalloprotease inhibitor [Alphaproteobacteria bacterium]MBL7098146.1 AprI/Inh family metalloprotease inhibitor [Alphaproteobacteria bacterium]
MNKSRFLALSFFLALSGMGSAYAQAPALAAGGYKLEVGATTPCDLTLTADGGVTQASDCATAHVTHWKVTGNSYVLYSADGEVYAVLKAKGDNLEGVVFADNRKLVLSH